LNNLANVPDTMQAAVCDGPGHPLQIRQHPTPTPQRGQYLVKLESCGICHSDLHLREGDENLPDEYYPLIFGHEGIGTIAAIGPDTENALPAGTRVGLPWLYSTCHHCRPCLTGHETYCAAQHARGVQQNGAFAEYAILEADFACVIPDEIDAIPGAPLLCAGLTAWSALNKTRVQPGSSVLVIGAGGLGQYAIQIAKARGAKVLVVDHAQSKLDAAIELGADQVFQADPEAGKAIRDAGGADITLNFAPSPAVWQTIETAANPMSDIVAIALVHDPVDLSMMWLIDGGHRVFGSSVGTRQETHDFLTFASSRPFAIDVETIPLSSVNYALDRLKSGAVKGRLCIDFSL
jgi:propanol-preferring alcohol dehydrogenase